MCVVTGEIRKWICLDVAVVKCYVIGYRIVGVIVSDG